MAEATHTFVIDGMHCASCGLLIDETLEDLPGVLRAQTSMKAGRSTVVLDPGQLGPAQIVAAITDAGYRAILEMP